MRALLSVQCLGAFNANLYKTVVSLMAANLALVGQGGAALLSLSSIVFVAPYILFSGYAGYVADRFDKRSVVIAAKLGEVLVMGLAFAALMVGRIELLVVILFLLSTQATFFSPAKYGILPEALASSRLSRANGVMEMTRYLAVILGTASAGLLLSVWHPHPARIGVVLVGVSATGLLLSLAIGRLPRPAGVKVFHINPWREIGEGMRRLAVDRRLALAVAGIAWFEFLCTLVMLDMILLGKTQMGLDDLHIGVLGAVVGIGAGAGSLMAGYLSGGRVQPGFALVGYVGIGAMLLGLVPATAAYVTTAVAFLVLGLFAGMVIVPLNALLQHASGADEKGRLIATSNLLGMSGVVAGSTCLWLLHDLGGIGPDRILILAAVLALSAVLWAAVRQPACTTRALLRLFASIRRSRDARSGRPNRMRGSAYGFDLPGAASRFKQLAACDQRSSMLAQFFLCVTRQSAGARRLLFRCFFEQLARRSQHADGWTLMNYGYAEGADGNAFLPLHGVDEPERYCIQLYHRVAGSVELANKDVLEVSSGRGGGASYVCRYLGPRTMTAVDIAPSAVGFCRRAHRLPGLRFIQGDAEDLPLFDSSVDVVINIEASFCYGSLDLFLQEVRRVLRPGGWFLYADLRLAAEAKDLMAALRHSGLELVRIEDITANVARALQLDGPRRAAGAARLASLPLRGVMRLFVGAPGTRVPALLSSGRMQYYCFVLRKSLDDAGPSEELPVTAADRAHPAAFVDTPREYAEPR